MTIFAQPTRAPVAQGLLFARVGGLWREGLID